MFFLLFAPFQKRIFVRHGQKIALYIYICANTDRTGREFVLTRCKDILCAFVSRYEGDARPFWLNLRCAPHFSE